MQARFHLAMAAIIFSLASVNCNSEELNVMNSGGFTAAYKALAPQFEHDTGNTLATSWGPSMGAAPQAIPNRLQRGEPADVVIMVGYALDQLIREGKVIASSRTALADSRIGVVVRAGASHPDISSPQAFKDALLKAGSIAYSDSASGVYIERELFKKLGIEDQVKDKSRMIPRIPVAGVVASGAYELGLQQVSELLPVAGVDFIGKIPESLQSITEFAAGIPVGARHPVEAQQLIRFLASPQAAPEVRKSGLDPL